MNNRTPAEPPPSVIRKKALSSAISPAFYVGTGEAVDARSDGKPFVEPQKSFFRGVAVGIAVMIPVWAWVIIRLLG